VFGCRCNTAGTSAAHDPDDARRTRSHDQGTRAGSSRSVVPRSRSAKAIAALWVCRECNGSNATRKHPAVDAVPIADEILWRALPTTRLRDLLGDPLGSRMRSDGEPQNAPSIVSED
jgi:hypothetical protein